MGGWRKPEWGKSILLIFSMARIAEIPIDRWTQQTLGRVGPYRNDRSQA